MVDAERELQDRLTAFARRSSRTSELSEHEVESVRADGSGFYLVSVPRTTALVAEVDTWGLKHVKRRGLAIPTDEVDDAGYLSSRESRRSLSNRPFVWHAGQ